MPAPSANRAVPPPGRHPAPLARRFGALVYEGLLLSALMLVGGFLLAPLVSPNPPGVRQLQLPSPSGRVFEFCVLFALGALYCVWSWSGARRTLAMKTWRLTLVRADGRALDRRTALARYLAAWLGPALALVAYLLLRPAGYGAHAAWLVGFNFLWAFIDPGRRFLHDRIAGTWVVVDRGTTRAGHGREANA
jgi:uncharacterized RDD family membrane protein YckC